MKSDCKILRRSIKHNYEKFSTMWKEIEEHFGILVKYLHMCLWECMHFAIYYITENVDEMA